MIRILFLMATLLMMGCTERIYVPQEKEVYRTDTLRVYNVRVDSVFNRDSVSLIQKGDTVFVTRYRDRFRYRCIKDTVYRCVTDTVRTTVPVPVGRNLTRWEEAKMDLGSFFLLLVSIAVCVSVIWLVKRFRN